MCLCIKSDLIEVLTVAAESETKLLVPLTSFIGCNNDIKGLQQVLSSGPRLITLTGPGG